MNYKEIIKIFIDIIEKPDAKKNYKDLKNYYLKIGKIEEAEALQYLIERKYAGNPDSSEKN